MKISPKATVNVFFFVCKAVICRNNCASEKLTICGKGKLPKEALSDHIDKDIEHLCTDIVQRNTQSILSFIISHLLCYSIKPYHLLYETIEVRNGRYDLERMIGLNLIKFH